MERKNETNHSWRDSIEIARVVAIFSVITAHLAGSVKARGAAGIVAIMQTWFGQIGVVTFLIIGGGVTLLEAGEESGVLGQAESKPAYSMGCLR